MTEAYRTVEIVEDGRGDFALKALANHLDRMEIRDQEPSGTYMTVHSIGRNGVSTEIKWPIPMPKRGDNIELGYN